MQESDLKFRSLWIIVTTFILFCYAQTIVAERGTASVAQEVQLVTERTTDSPEPAVDEDEPNADEPESVTDAAAETLALAAIGTDTQTVDPGPSLTKADSAVEQDPKELSDSLDAEEDSLVEKAKTNATASKERVVAAKQTVAEVAEVDESSLVAAAEESSKVVNTLTDATVEAMTNNEVTAEEVKVAAKKTAKEKANAIDKKSSAPLDKQSTTTIDKTISKFDAAADDAAKEIAQPVLPKEPELADSVVETISKKRPKNTVKPTDEINASSEDLVAETSDRGVTAGAEPEPLVSSVPNTKVDDAKEVTVPDENQESSKTASTPSEKTVEPKPEVAPEVDVNAPPVPPGLSADEAKKPAKTVSSKKPWLGLRLDQPTPRIDKVYPGSGASETDIKPGDVIIRINDEELLNTVEVVNVVTGFKASETISVTVRRDSEEIEFDIFLGNSRPTAPAKETPSSEKTAPVDEPAS